MLKPQKLDELHLPDHCYLTSEDVVYFLREYTPRAGYAYSATNQLILNFKKTMDRKGKAEWQYKEKAINQITAEIGSNVKIEWLQLATLIPIPPSKATTNPLYDDRMTQVLSGLGPLRNIACDVRELIVQKSDMRTVHLHNDDRPTPSEIQATYEINESLAQPAPKDIGLFDDVLTTGAHFRAAKNILSARFPGVRIIGFFVARRVPALELANLLNE